MSEHQNTWRRQLRKMTGAALSLDLGDETIYLAEELVSLAHLLGEEERVAIAIAVLALAAVERQGSTCLPLSGPVFLQPVRALCKSTDLAMEPSRIARILRKLADPSHPDLVRLVGLPGEQVPLIVRPDSLASHRMHEIESRIATVLRPQLATAATGRPAFDRGDIEQRQSFSLSDEQWRAVESTLDRSLSLVSGGPGTGKTAICATVCRALVRRELQPEDIALCAPTGKAAQRLDSAIRTHLAGIDNPVLEDRALIERLQPARTIHRLLGYQPKGGQYRHHAQSPLAAKVIIVDEASMVDIALMERLMRAMPSQARLVLFGDAEQLPSVEAGAIMRDLVAIAESTGSVSRLTHSYRIDPTDPSGAAILEAAAAVRGKRPDLKRIPCVASPDQLGYSGVERLQPSCDPEFQSFIESWFARNIMTEDWIALARPVYSVDRGDGCPAEIETLLKILEKTKILCATRRGTWGVQDVNARLCDLAAGAMAMPSEPLVPGQAVVMRENDYQRGLFNGDHGVVVRVSRDGQAAQLAIAMQGPQGPVLYDAEVLGARMEAAFAITVHQSQGSEYQRIALVLPPVDRPILTKELIYTGLTRAKQAVAIVAGAKVLEAAVRRTHDRYSGLATALAHPSRAKSLAK